MDKVYRLTTKGREWVDSVGDLFSTTEKGWVSESTDPHFYGVLKSIGDFPCTKEELEITHELSPKESKRVFSLIRSQGMAELVRR